MHKSRLSCIVIDCHTDHVEQAAGFWSQLLGFPSQADDGRRATVMTGEGGVRLVIEAVADESRIHFDMETDDLSAEILRIEGIGGRKIAVVDHAVIMEAPTGHRFRLTAARNNIMPAGGVLWGED